METTSSWCIMVYHYGHHQEHHCRHPTGFCSWNLTHEKRRSSGHVNQMTWLQDLIHHYSHSGQHVLWPLPLGYSSHSLFFHEQNQNIIPNQSNSGKFLCTSSFEYLLFPWVSSQPFVNLRSLCLRQLSGNVLVGNGKQQGNRLKSIAAPAW